ncbi:MAG: TrkA family potassium uptake protein [Actinomycetota bacterium]|nr:TrkA family potassium uptake protein [Actinomycetota bacterium]
MIVVGCGRVGSELAARLDQEGHTSFIIDKNVAAFRRLPPNFSGSSLEGLGFDRDCLKAAGVEHADALAAVTSGDNSNILTARIAKETFEVPKVVARIYDPKRAEIYRRLGISTVATVTWTTEQAMRRLFDTEAKPDWIDSNGQFVLLERGVPEALIGHRYSALKANFEPILLTRGTTTRRYTPEIVIQDGDILHFLIERDNIISLDSTISRMGDHHK